MEGDLAFFTFNSDGSQSECHILSAGTSVTQTPGSGSKDSANDNNNNNKFSQNNDNNNSNSGGRNAVIVIERGQYHALTAAPKSLGYAGYSVVFEASGRKFDPAVSTKVSYYMYLYVYIHIYVCIILCCILFVCLCD